MSRWALVGTLLAALACSLNAVSLFNHDLWLPDEPREAEIAREYVQREGWVVPWLNGGRWLEKPPLWHWCAAALFRWQGEATPGLARIPSALAGVGMGLCAWLLARRFGPPGLAPWAAFLTWTSAELVNTAHRATVDALFSFWVVAALTCFALGLGTAGPWAVGMAAAAGLAFLTKFHLGPVLIGATVLAFCAAKRTWAPLRGILRPLPVLVFLAVVVPWPWLLHHYQARVDLDQAEIQALAGQPVQETGMAKHALEEVLWGQLLKRSTGGDYGHANPFWYYLPNLFTFAAPWSLCLILVLPWAWNRMRREGDPLCTLALCWLLGMALLLSIPKAKRVVYLTPAVPAVALLVAAWGRDVLGRWSLKGPILGLAAVLGALSAGFPGLCRWMAGAGGGAEWAGALFGAAVLGGLLAFRGYPRAGLAALGGWLILLALAVDAILVPAVDREESFAPAARMLRQLSESGREGPKAIVGYALSENQQGAFGFALGRRLRCYTEPKHLADRLRESPCVVVLSWDSWEGLLKDPEIGKLARLAGEGRASGQRLAFLVSRWPPGTIRGTGGG